MSEVSQESIIMTLLEQIRALEEERDSALELANKLKGSKTTECNSGNDEEATSENDTLQSVLMGLEEMRMNEEQRQINLEESQKVKNRESGMDNENYKEMLEMCKKYYGKMVSELQQEKSSLQKKVESQQSQLLDKDMLIAELQMKLGKHKP
ncbi:predicted protein [Nematostella vectensis]|uniref:Uncharacterized protein n=1 Tax=Nematostella vectensis TaxID=45351 RepID=A7SQU8_NEMVE|nr:uncharacterized protein LOC5505152 [Nematostella vectensis]EDO33922.1 predicted protein [Nematostella vectensis]|eukprot:XP_001626022.1 predicted protein [Nematostella vectensis]